MLPLLLLTLLLFFFSPLLLLVFNVVVRDPAAAATAAVNLASTANNFPLSYNPSGLFLFFFFSFFFFFFLSLIIPIIPILIFFNFPFLNPLHGCCFLVLPPIILSPHTPVRHPPLYFLLSGLPPLLVVVPRVPYEIGHLPHPVQHVVILIFPFPIARWPSVSLLPFINRRWSLT